jgi:tetratricopeptide (TPR) repeat protein
MPCSSLRALLPLLLLAACSPPQWETDMRLGVDAAQRGETEEAERLIAAALAAGPSEGMRRDQQADLLAWLGWLQSTHVDQAPSVATLEQATALLRETKGVKALETRRAIRRLAQVRSNLGDLAGAEAGFREYLEIVRTSVALDDPERFGGINDMAYILARQGRLDEAQQTIDKGFAELDRYRPKDEDVRLTLTLIAADVKRRRGELAEAERLYRESIARAGDAEGRRVYRADAYAGLAGTLAASGRADEADGAFREALNSIGDSPRAASVRAKIEEEYAAFRGSP